MIPFTHSTEDVFTAFGLSEEGNEGRVLKFRATSPLYRNRLSSAFTYIDLTTILRRTVHLIAFCLSIIFLRLRYS